MLRNRKAAEMLIDYPVKFDTGAIPEAEACGLTLGTLESEFKTFANGTEALFSVYMDKLWSIRWMKSIGLKGLRFLILRQDIPDSPA